jgi:hypothetical protein
MVSATIADKDFQKLITKRARTLLGLANHVSQCRSRKGTMIRPLLGGLLSQSTQLEELLDSYGASHNCQWCGFRSLTAVFKLFSDVSYELLHIRYSLDAYRLLPIEKDFVKATDETLDFTCGVLRRAAKQILANARRLGLSVPPESPRERFCPEELPAGRLSHGCQTRQIGPGPRSTPPTSQTRSVRKSCGFSSFDSTTSSHSTIRMSQAPKPHSLIRTCPFSEGT